MKKIFKISIISLLLLALVLGAVSCGGASMPDSEGEHGAISWKYSSEAKTLTLTGSGEIGDLASSEEQPWASVLDYTEKLIISEGITKIGSNAFYGASAIKSISLPASLTSIGKAAFSFCSAVEAISIPASVTDIADGAFLGCSSLGAVFVPASVVNMGKEVFAYCYGLEDIAFLAKIDIPERTFLYCRAAKNLILHKAFDGESELALGLTIAENAFEGASVSPEKATYTESDTASATVTVTFMVEGEVLDTKVVADLAYGAAYSITAPAKEGYTPEKLNVTGNVYGEDIELTVNYVKDPEPEATTPATDNEEKEEPIDAGTIISVVVLVLVIAGIAVGAYFVMKAEKKANQKDAMTVRKNTGDKKRK